MMLWADLVHAVLAALGVWQKKEVKILLLGLDNAGKRSLLRTVKFGGRVQHQPTQLPTSDELSIGRLRFKAVDLAGFQTWHGVLRDYYGKVDAVVYVVDANDRERFAESKIELDALLFEASLAKVPFLILGNKTDIPSAVSEDKLRLHMGLSKLITGKPKMHFENLGRRPLELFMCSIEMATGLIDGFKWLSQYVK